jgi:hypothetical protein
MNEKLKFRKKISAFLTRLPSESSLEIILLYFLVIFYVYLSEKSVKL